jgi:hypothetical protein
MCCWTAFQEKKRLGWEVYAVPLADPQNPSLPNPRLVNELTHLQRNRIPFSQNEVENAIHRVISQESSFGKTLFLVDCPNFFPLAPGGRGELTTALFVIANYNIMLFAGHGIRKELTAGIDYTTTHRVDKFSRKTKITRHNISYLFVPQLALFKALLEEKFDSPSIPNLVLGKSKVSDIYELVDQRDCFIPFPGAMHLDKIDGNPNKTLLSMTIHDMYHNYDASTRGSDRKLIVMVRDFIRSYAKRCEEPLRQKYLHKAWRIYDESPMYRDSYGKRNFEPCELFLLHLCKYMHKNSKSLTDDFALELMKEIDDPKYIQFKLTPQAIETLGLQYEAKNPFLGDALVTDNQIQTIITLGKVAKYYRNEYSHRGDSPISPNLRNE